MSEQPEPFKTTEARLAELEKYVTRMRVGLIAVASLIIWQATSAMGWLGPIRIYATEVYAQQFILEDEEQKVHGRWEITEQTPAQLTVFDDTDAYVRLNAQGLSNLKQLVETK